MSIHPADSSSLDSSWSNAHTGRAVRPMSPDALALYNVSIGDRLSAIRIAAGHTQRTLAIECGVGEKTISSFETDQRVPSIKLAQLAAILKACGVSFVDFFNGLNVPLSPRRQFPVRRYKRLRCRCGHSFRRHDRATGQCECHEVSGGGWCQCPRFAVAEVR